MALQFHKTFIFTYFFMRLTFAFYSKRMKTIQAIKSPLCFEVIPCNNAHNFFTAR